MRCYNPKMEIVNRSMYRNEWINIGIYRIMKYAGEITDPLPPNSYVYVLFKLDDE